MKKKLIMGVAAAICGIAFAEDSYLYWQINQESNPIEFTYAQVKATKDGGDIIYVGEEMLGVDGFMDGKTATWAGPINSAFDASVYGEGFGYSFVVELMNSELDVIGESAAFSYANIAPYIYSSMSQTGATPWTVTTFNAVPEPSSAVLLLFGLAGLALRRKERNKPMNMKQILLTATILAGSFAFGDANDTIFTFSTQGPDTYGDGATVLNGERYALIWVKDGAAFSGLKADGQPLAETTKVIAIAPLAKGGKCPETVFEIDAEFAETLKGGSFGLYLLDTRVSATELAKEENFSVNAAGVASSAISSTAQLSTSQLSTSVALATVGVYTKIEEPKIEAMKVEGAKIEFKVSGMSGAADYMVVNGAEPGKVGAKMATTVQGDTLIVDKPEGCATFFKVIGTRKFK